MKKNNISEINFKLIHDINYSFRRYYVDKFFIQKIEIFPEKSIILDMGGKKINKRGYFDISIYDFNVKYANLDKSTEPDFFCDIASIPVNDNSFDGVILSEVLEHLPDPVLALKEVFRVLRPGGKFLLVAPFMYHIHADPYDYGRYTDYWYTQTLERLGFNIVYIEKQGLFFSVMANQLKSFAYELRKMDKPKGRIKRDLFTCFVNWFVKHSFQWDECSVVKKSSVLRNTTTGFGIICNKN